MTPVTATYADVPTQRAWAVTVSAICGATDTATTLISSTFPALSVERYRSSCCPCPETVTVPVYGAQAPPSREYSVLATPDVSSVAERVAGTPPLSAAPTVAVVTGAVASTLTVSVLRTSTLPALSTER